MRWWTLCWCLRKHESSAIDLCWLQHANISVACSKLTCKREVQARLSIKDVSSATGILLVDYLYTGNIQMSIENAEAILAASDRFLLTKLKKIAEDFLCGQVGSTNCVSFRYLARLFSLNSLLEVTQKYLTDHSKELIDTESEMNQLTQDDLIALLGTHGSDEASFLLLQKWSTSFKERTPRFMDLLRSLELRLFTKEFVLRTVMREKLMHNPKGMKIIQQALESLVIADPNQFLVVGDFNRNIYEGRHFHASIGNQDEFMVIGGETSDNLYLKSAECLNMKTLEWSQMPDLPDALSLSQLVYVQNQLFVLYEQRYSVYVHYYDHTGRAWRPRCQMPEVCVGGGAVSFDNKIFVVGGKSRSCMQYDPHTDAWVKLQRPQLESIFSPAVVWKGKILVCGGRQADSIEKYDPQSDEWAVWDVKVPTKQDMCFALLIKEHC
ncbi:hypothetical protein CAPTEDRAFT_136065 [Capitella teleta]|uniref:BACK domain-containing protein n=1 Tax=Capitella teleta TaxID=283909 RepID=R7VA79_CAPTE|nr:hypothetical protein CAPTEDRAFT_136065 [Capitella teleta]|eukprot:ELU13231.1 hypothetical protein CAPTEDRAFT_136065 [Capitella teleta]